MEAVGGTGGCPTRGEWPFPEVMSEDSGPLQTVQGILLIMFIPFRFGERRDS